MMVADFTNDAPKAADRAAGLFADWLGELNDGPLKAHIERLSNEYRNLDGDELRLVVYSDSSDSPVMCGAWKVDGRTEIVGPYVQKGWRQMGLGKTALRTSFTVTWGELDMYLYAPLQSDWTPAKLEDEGIERVACVLPDGAGDHYTFHANVARRASHYLQGVREPRGGGSWVVMLHNDDESTFDFVSAVLQSTIDVNPEIAFEYASLVHAAGVATIRNCRTEWGAKRLVARIEDMAKREGYPLRATYEQRR